MSATTERQLARLRARFELRAHELADVGFILRGTILQRFSHCGSPGCACHTDADRMHGPYWQWTAKVRGKTVTRSVSEEQLSRYRLWMDNAKRFDEIVGELQDLSAQAHALLTALERASAAPGKEEATSKRPPRRRTPPGS